VRVTPEGFQLRLPLADWTPGADERNALHLALRGTPGHGAALAGYAIHEFNAKETEDMKHIDDTTAATLPSALVAGQAVVRCTFDDGGRTYGYYAGGLELKDGDAVVVASPYGDGPGNRGTFDEGCGGYLKVVRVVSVEPDVQSIERAAKWIIGRVDTAEYVARRLRIEELQVLDAQIQRAAREAQKLVELEALKAVSPELTALLAKRAELAK